MAQSDTYGRWVWHCSAKIENWVWHFSNILNLTSSNSSTIFQKDQQILTMNGYRPRDGDHPRDDDYLNDHPYPPDSNPYPHGYSRNHPGCPDHLYWLLIKVSSTYTHIQNFSTLWQPPASGQRPWKVKKVKMSKKSKSPLLTIIWYLPLSLFVQSL